MFRKPSYKELKKRVQDLESAELEFKKMDDLLKEEVDWRRLLIEESRDGVVILDMNGKVIEANKKYAEMLGYTLKELQELHIWDWETKFKKQEIQNLLSMYNNSFDLTETYHRRKDGSVIAISLTSHSSLYRGKKLIYCVSRDISKFKKSEIEKEGLIAELQEALSEISTLRGILPLCSYCKKIRDDKGYWEQVDIYISKHLDADISHSICPDCMKEHYPDQYTKIFPHKE